MADLPTPDSYVAVDTLPELGEGIVLFTVYDSPLDYLGQYVVRRFLIAKDESFVEREAWIVTPHLAQARASIPEGMHYLPRDPVDDPAILEVWI